LAVNIKLAQAGLREEQWLQEKVPQALLLAPVNQLLPDPQGASFWRATGNDPWFEVSQASGQPLSEGWFLLTLVMDTDAAKKIAKFYTDYGDGHTEHHAANLHFQSKLACTRVLHFRGVVKSLRFDPLEEPGTFRMQELTCQRVDEAQALQEMLDCIARASMADAPRSADHVREAVRQQCLATGKSFAEQLVAAYEECMADVPRPSSYAQWIETIEKPSLPSKEQAALLVAALEHKPLVSVLVPVYNTNPEYLRVCIDSVRRQSYPYWELCIADDASPLPHVSEVLRDYQAQDPRIKLCFREQNGHIAHASNSALALAAGEFVALLDHDDVLSEHALLYVVQAINQTPDAQVLYSDEDKLNKDGERWDVHFKSDWNPDLFFSQNYVSHLGVYRHALLKRIDGFRPGLEGSQDHDLLLRCLPHIHGPQIVHIPKVLYHWRSVEGSTALGAQEKNYTTRAGIKALRDYFSAHGPKGVTVNAGRVPNTYKISWPIPQPAPLVSLLIPTRDRKEVTEVAVRSILDKTTYQNFEILILDNGSTEPQTLHWFNAIQRQDARVKVLRYDHPFNYSAINNFGAEHARGSILGLVNNDVEVISPDWLSEMVGHACRPDVGCVGAKLYYQNDTLQHGGVIIGIGGVAGHSHKYAKRQASGYFARLLITQTMSAVTAACLVVRKDVYQQAGGLDAKNLAVAFNDIDFCLRVMQAGYRNLWTPHAELYHYESVSRGTEDTPEKKTRFQKEVRYMKKKWGSALERDPFYSPHLSMEREDFSIRLI
jgi:GT2 family glycosyltransferase